MPNTKLIGTFVLRDEGNGNLSSVYHNTEADKPYQEICKLDLLKSPKDLDKFCGIYDSIWQEDNPAQHDANLEITFDAVNFRYALTRRDITNTTVLYRGTGMLYKDIMVGAYWQA